MRRRFRTRRTGSGAVSRARLAFLAVCLSLILVGVSIVKELLRRYTISTEVDSLRSEISQLEQENADLQSLMVFLKSPTYSEQEGRLKLGFQRPGERVLAVPGTDGSEPAAQESAGSPNRTDEARPASNIAKWWAFLFTRHIDTPSSS